MSANYTNSMATNPTFVWADITPDKAARWLEGNVRNRKVKQRHVDMLAQEMLTGNWKLTHQGIAFDTANTLIDGQHRLWAVLQSGCTIRTAVWLGVSAEGIEAIDGAKGRSRVDRMAISREFGAGGVNNNHAATLREALRGLNTMPKLSYHEEARLMKMHIDAVRFAVAHVAARSKGIATAYVRAVIARAWYSVEADSLARFCRVLSSGMPELPHDDGIIRLRDQLMAAGSARNMEIRREFYRKVESVLVTWLKGESRSVIRPVSREHFPLPGE